MSETIELTLEQLLAHAEANSSKRFEISHRTRCLAASCATELSGYPRAMVDFSDFFPSHDQAAVYARLSVPKTYARWCANQCGDGEGIFFDGADLAVVLKGMIANKAKQQLKGGDV